VLPLALRRPAAGPSRLLTRSRSPHDATQCLRSTFERNGASVVVDDVSLDMLRGATVDFEMEMVRQGFVVLNNPNAESGCGCGVSFGLKEDDF